MIKKLGQMFYLQGMETILGAFALILLYLMKSSPVPIVSYLFVTMLGSILFSFLLIKFEEKAKFFFCIFVMPAILVAGFIVGLPLYVSLPISFFVFLRGISHYQDPQKQSESFWLLSSFLIGALSLVLTSGKEVQELIYYLLFLQLAFTFIGGFINRLINLEIDKSEKKGLLQTFSWTMGAIVLIGIFVSAGLGVFRSIIFTVMKGFIWIMGWVFTPLFFWAEDYEIKSNPSPKLKIKAGKSIDGLKGTKGENLDISMLFIILMVIAVVGVIIFIIKKKNIVKEPNVDKKGKSSYRLSSSSILPNELMRNPRDIKAPSNAIRKQVFEFERFAKKLQIGRKNYETFSDWMERLGIQDYQFLNTLYEKVRYGEGVDDLEKEKKFIEDLKKKKSTLKILQKQLIESGELVIESKKIWRKNKKSNHVDA